MSTMATRLFTRGGMDPPGGRRRGISARVPTRIATTVEEENHRSSGDQDSADKNNQNDKNKRITRGSVQSSSSSNQRNKVTAVTTRSNYSSTRLRRARTDDSSLGPTAKKPKGTMSNPSNATTTTTPRRSQRNVSLPERFQQSPDDDDDHDHSAKEQQPAAAASVETNHKNTPPPNAKFEHLLLLQSEDGSWDVEPDPLARERELLLEQGRTDARRLFERRKARVLESLAQHQPPRRQGRNGNVNNNLFGQVGFAKWQRTWLPALTRSPYDVPPGKVRRRWMEDYRARRRKNQSLEDMPILVYWYGVTKPHDYYSFVKPTAFVPYEQATTSMINFASPALQKQASGKPLSRHEAQRILAHEELAQDLTKDPSDRRRGVVDFKECYDLLDETDFQVVAAATTLTSRPKQTKNNDDEDDDDDVTSLLSLERDDDNSSLGNNNNNNNTDAELQRKWAKITTTDTANHNPSSAATIEHQTMAGSKVMCVFELDDDDNGDPKDETLNGKSSTNIRDTNTTIRRGVTEINHAQAKEDGVEATTNIPLDSNLKNATGEVGAVTTESGLSGPSGGESMGQLEPEDLEKDPTSNQNMETDTSTDDEPHVLLKRTTQERDEARTQCTNLQAEMDRLREQHSHEKKRLEKERDSALEELNKLKKKITVARNVLEI